MKNNKAYLRDLENSLIRENLRAIIFKEEVLSGWAQNPMTSVVIRDIQREREKIM